MLIEWLRIRARLFSSHHRAGILYQDARNTWVRSSWIERTEGVVKINWGCEHVLGCEKCFECGGWIIISKYAHQEVFVMYLMIPIWPKRERIKEGNQSDNTWRRMVPKKMKVLTTIFATIPFFILIIIFCHCILIWKYAR